MELNYMTQEGKNLLIQDLCARLPYGVKIALKNNEAYHHDNIAKRGDVTIDKLKGFDGSYFSIYHDDPLDWDWYVNDVDVEDIKPYLFPLSSMTEEQQKEANIFDDMDMDILSENLGRNHRNKTNIPTATHNYTDWLDKNLFDYRGLIPMGLAIDATGLNIY